VLLACAVVVYRKMRQSSSGNVNDAYARGAEQDSLRMGAEGSEHINQAAGQLAAQIEQVVIPVEDAMPVMPEDAMPEQVQASSQVFEPQTPERAQTPAEDPPAMPPVPHPGDWEVQTDSGWAPWTPGVAFTAEAGSEVTFTVGRFTYTGSFVNATNGFQTNTATGKKRMLRPVSIGFEGTWEIQTDTGWAPWTPADAPFTGMPGEVVEYQLGRFTYQARFEAGGSGSQTNTTTNKTRPLRFKPASGQTFV